MTLCAIFLFFKITPLLLNPSVTIHKNILLMTTEVTLKTRYYKYLVIIISGEKPKQRNEVEWFQFTMAQPKIESRFYALIFPSTTKCTVVLVSKTRGNTGML